MSILIVDDTAVQRQTLAALLTAHGYSDVLVAASAAEAFGQLGVTGSARHAPAIDLILMDIRMPGLDGIAACRRIKAVAQLHDIPIIMVTSSDDTGDLQLAFDAGAMDYLIKPPNTVELLARVRSALKLKQEMDARKARERELLDLAQLLHEERERSDLLLLNILPEQIANRLKQHPGVIAEHYDQVTVMFADILNFTPLSALISPGEVVALLNEVFSAFDQLAERHGLEKIKTIGDAYMAASGLPMPRADHATAAAAMALDMQAALAVLNVGRSIPLQIRIGLHSGPVVAGVIGTKKFIYDLWGDTVNIASRMESHSATDAIQITRATYELIRDDFTCRPQGRIAVKGKGEMEVWQIVAAAPQLAKAADDRAVSGYGRPIGSPMRDVLVPARCVPLPG
jgi:adenylate cyclase